ncbi:MAG TPA: hypothetical protein VHG29_00905 [Novosphingobium sp.]|nr:hypothetical protein [Novosphingobium sp.]
MDQAALLAMLPTAQRLALSYARRDTRLPTLALLALDARLAGIVRATHEPLMGQIRLAWWRDRLGADRTNWPLGEPVLQALCGWEGEREALGALVDGWEAMLGDGAGRIEHLGSTRAAGFAALASQLGAGPADASAAAFRWSLVDCAEKLGDPELQAEAAALLAVADWPSLRLGRALRPLQVLYGLARRAHSNRQPRLLATPGDGLAAIRLGLFGR